MRQAWFFNEDADRGDGSNYFFIPSDCSVVWATGCGGGAGGVTSFQSTAFGGQGGAASLFVIRYPLAVIPNGILIIGVGMGCLGGHRVKLGVNNWASNGVGTQSSGEGTGSRYATIIAGDLVGPEVWSVAPYFNLGYAGSVPNTLQGPQGKVSGAQGSQSELVFHNLNVAPHFPHNVTLPSCNGELGTTPFGTPTSSTSPAGRNTGNGTGLGAYGAWGSQYGSYAGQAVATFGYSDGGLVGAGGAGGGGPFGVGGAGGVPWVNGGQGGDATGFGCGGGGSCWGSLGGNGGPGFLLLEY